MKWIPMLGVFCAAIVAFGADEKPKMPDEQIFKPLLGKRVTLDGLAWENPDQWLGRVVLPSGHVIYATPAFEEGRTFFPLKPRLPRGHLVRLVGLFTLGEDQSNPPQRPEGASYFALELESVTPIDRVERTYPHDTAKPEVEEKEEVVETLPAPQI
ncbi:MAG: hypothetical protein EOP84_30755 [Verrucomicrobiaceae bacterium]|nr:MAG: hypothetical protein EOP84_30755 [Verrucomicrobiaceae bacterium]